MAQSFSRDEFGIDRGATNDAHARRFLNEEVRH